MINRSKLKKVVQRDGKIEAQCPACAQAGADSKGNHLVLFPDGKFGCVANPNDNEHNKIILRLVGERGFTPPPQLEIRRQIIPDSSVILRLGHPGRKKSTPAEPGAESNVPDPHPPEPPKESSVTAANEADINPPRNPKEFKAEDVRRFLDEP